jgi:hypothetical protein
MGRFEILKTDKIIKPNFHTVEPIDKNVAVTMNRINNHFGQYKSITVCEHDGQYLIVDGGKYFKTLKALRLKKILCYNLGELKPGEYELYRIALNVHQSRLDYLGIAQAVARLKELEIKPTTISNKTGLDQQTVERYMTLLHFDWDEFNRMQFNPQFNPFEDER